MSYSPRTHTDDAFTQSELRHALSQTHGAQATSPLIIPDKVFEMSVNSSQSLQSPFIYNNW